jgi:hypothetical protein
MPPAVAIALDEPPPEYSVAAHLPTYDQAELSKGKIPVLYYIKTFPVTRYRYLPVDFQ